MRQKRVCVSDGAQTVARPRTLEDFGCPPSTLCRPAWTATGRPHVPAAGPLGRSTWPDPPVCDREEFVTLEGMPLVTLEGFRLLHIVTAPPLF